MAVFAVDGRFGSGKTAYSVWFARRLVENRGGVPLWANFHIEGMAAEVHRIEDLYSCEGGVIVLDELQGTIHARRSNHNLEFMAWFDQCRKQDSDIICITQALHKIDVIVREMIDIAFSCEDKGDSFSRVTPIDMYTERARSSFVFDRRVSFDLYNHRERAWALVGKGDKTADRKSSAALGSKLETVVPLGAVESRKGRLPWNVG